jgi:hypothetical protein
MTYADEKWKEDYETINQRKLHHEKFSTLDICLPLLR